MWTFYEYLFRLWLNICMFWQKIFLNKKWCLLVVCFNECKFIVSCKEHTIQIVAGSIFNWNVKLVNEFSSFTYDINLNNTWHRVKKKIWFISAQGHLGCYSSSLSIHYWHVFEVEKVSLVMPNIFEKVKSRDIISL